MDIKSIVKKLSLLAEQGERGEKETASRKLEEICKKYGLSEDEILEETVEDYYMCHYKTDYEKRLLEQIIFMVTNRCDNLYTVRNKKKTIACKCTEAENIEIKLAFDYYTGLFKKDLDIFTEAFIQKHQLFSKTAELPFSPKEPNQEEIKKMQFMSMGMENGGYKKMLENKDL